MGKEAMTAHDPRRVAEELRDKYKYLLDSENIAMIPMLDAADLLDQMADENARLKRIARKRRCLASNFMRHMAAAEAWRDTIDDELGERNAENARLIADNAALREALGIIAFTECGPSISVELDAAASREVARDALAATQDDGWISVEGIGPDDSQTVWIYPATPHVMKPTIYQIQKGWAVPDYVTHWQPIHIPPPPVGDGEV